MTTARSSLLRAVVIAVGPERLAPPHGDPHGLANNGLTRWPAGGHSDLDPANHTGLYDDLTHEYHLQMISPSGGSTKPMAVPQASVYNRTRLWQPLGTPASGGPMKIGPVGRNSSGAY